MWNKFAVAYVNKKTTTLVNTKFNLYDWEEDFEYENRIELIDEKVDGVLAWSEFKNLSY